jgi:hypothetical protein
LSPLGWLEWWVCPNIITPTIVDWYVLAGLFLEFIAAINVAKIAGWASWLQWIVLVFAALRILELIRVWVSVVLFDEGVVASVQRTFATTPTILATTIATTFTEAGGAVTDPEL